jgi:PAS domain S-box-containing protein
MLLKWQEKNLRNAEATEKLVQHILEIARGDFSISEKSLKSMKNSALRDVLLGLTLLNEDLQHQRTSLEINSKDHGKINRHILELARGECSISDEEIVKHKETVKGEILLGLSFLHGTIEYQRNSLEASALALSQKNDELENRVLKRTHSLKLKMEELKKSNEKNAQLATLAAASSESEAASARYVESILQSLSEVLFVVDQDGFIETANMKATEILEYSQDELQGRNLKDIICDDVFVANLMDLMPDGKIEDFETSYRSKSGCDIPVCLNGSFLTDNCGNTTHIVFSARDQRDSKLLQELKATQEQLVQSAKLASLGEMSAGLAHELNNPLFIISANTGLIIRGFADKGRYKQQEMTGFASAIRENAKRMERIIRHFRDFSRQAEHRFVEFNVDQVVAGSLILLEEQLRIRSIKLKMDLRADVTVVGDPNRIEQVLVNLIVNARDAIADAHGERGGNLVIQTCIAEDTVQIKIEDDGKGVAKDIQGKIFDPFFTTKEVGNGCGLGLSISYGIMKDHNGTIDVVSRANVGSQFTLTLPLPKEENKERVA